MKGLRFDRVCCVYCTKRLTDYINNISKLVVDFMK